MQLILVFLCHCLIKFLVVDECVCIVAVVVRYRSFSLYVCSLSCFFPLISISIERFVMAKRLD